MSRRGPNRQLPRLRQQDFSANRWHRSSSIRARNTAKTFIGAVGGGGRNRTGVHGFAGLGWIALDQRPSPDSLSPKRRLSLFCAVVLLGFLRGGESSFPAQLLPVKGRPHVEPSARAPSC